MEKINILISFNYHSYFTTFFHPFISTRSHLLLSTIYSYGRRNRRRRIVPRTPPPVAGRGVGPHTPSPECQPPHAAPLAASPPGIQIGPCSALDSLAAIPAVTNLGDLGSAEADLYRSTSSPSNAASC